MDPVPKSDVEKKSSNGLSITFSTGERLQKKMYLGESLWDTIIDIELRNVSSEVRKYSGLKPSIKGGKVELSVMQSNRPVEHASPHPQFAQKLQEFELKPGESIKSQIKFSDYIYGSVIERDPIKICIVFDTQYGKLTSNLLTISMQELEPADILLTKQVPNLHKPKYEKEYESVILYRKVKLEGQFWICLQRISRRGTEEKTHRFERVCSVHESTDFIVTGISGGEKPFRLAYTDDKSILHILELGQDSAQIIKRTTLTP